MCDETAFRDGITALGLLYAAGIRPGTTVWAPGTAPLAPKAWVGRGIRPTKLRREPGNEPVTVKALAMALPPQAWNTVTWREDTHSDRSGRFTALRVRPAHRDYLATEMRPEEWLLIEWPEGTGFDHDFATALNRRTRKRPGTLSALQLNQSEVKFVTQ